MKTINISNPTYFSAHRSGWGYAMNSLLPYHDSRSILLDDFLDITFGYSYEHNLQNKKIPYKKPWIGFLHHPPHICPWYDEDYRSSIDIHNFLNTDVFKTSLEKCRGIFVLSEYLKQYLHNNFDQFRTIPIFVLKHPTEFGMYDWNFEKFKTFYRDSGIKLISVGYFLRNLASLFLVSCNKKLDKILLPSHLPMALTNLEKEFSYKDLDIDKKSVRILNWQHNDFYDKIMEQSVVFLDLYDTSCNNAIIESVIRNTPIIINKHPAAIEYIGDKYPGYYKKLDDVASLLTYDSIQSCAEYLKNQPKHELTSDYFSLEFQKYLSKIDTTIKISPKQKNKSIDSYDSLLVKTSKFVHRFGWEWAMSDIKKNNTLVSKKPQNSLYCNDFVEHVFSNDKYGKSVIIDNKKYGLVKGYNLFPIENTEAIIINGQIHKWNNQSQKWEIVPEDDEIRKEIRFSTIQTYKSNDWVGFLHNPINMPRWFDYNQNIKSLLHNTDFMEALDNCKMIFTLSQFLKQQIDTLFENYNLSNIPVKVLYHPVPEVPSSKQWSMELFLETKNIIQIGYWMRKMHSFWQLQTDLNKLWLYGDKFSAPMIEMENVILGKKDVLDSNSISHIKRIINEEGSGVVSGVYLSRVNDVLYDKFMRSSVVYVNFYDCSASNTVVECIASCTPIIVNRLPAIEEYLGKDYPLYFDKISEASRLSRDMNKIHEAHEYLRSNRRLRDRLNIQQFTSNFFREINKICKK